MSLYYTWNDLHSSGLAGRTVFYRIMESDMDGKTFFTKIKRVSIPEVKTKFTLLYNPVKNEAVFNYTGTERKHVLIRFIDHLGRVLMATQQYVDVGPNQIRISTQNLVNGIYEVELPSNNEQHFVRLIKE